MRIRDIMSARPVVVRRDEPAGEIARLMAAADVRHLPVVEDGDVVGVWTPGPGGEHVLLGPERVHRAQGDDDAAAVMEALMGEAEIAVVWDEGAPAGVVTRADAVAILRAALDRGIGRRHRRPVIVRLAGPAGAGKTTLLIQALSRLPRVATAVVQANASVPSADEAGGAPRRLMGAPVVEDPHAHWRAGLARAVERLGDAQLILVEDRDGTLEESPPIGEDAQVAVMPAGRLGELRAEALTDVQALVVTRMDEADDVEVARALEPLRARCAGMEVFPVAAGRDDRGVDGWARWLEALALRR
ncbi:CBS domain-containing protein [Miltoncostaea marina]|uniref:CBS domain-containing protein n=1 Tax=Miltoncostaea marina TaxID=2843215 RepID=UPI001C3C9748|nr:CBS domain-containing protein [Miltoncostaea marina]